MMGTANVALSVSKIAEIPVPIIFPELQRRVDELLALCDKLEAAQAHRNQAHQRFGTASLAGLSQPKAAQSFREDAAFTLQQLDALSARPEQIKALRQSILELAVRGKLVPQDPNDEPASELLKRIQAEKASIERKKSILYEKATKSYSAFLADTPNQWEIAKLQAVCLSITDGDHQPPPTVENGVPFLVIGDVRSQHIEFSNCRYVSEQYYSELDPIRRPQKGDLLYTLVGSYGIPVIVSTEQEFCVQRHIGILRPSKLIMVEYLAYAMKSDVVFAQATKYATGIAQKTVSLSGLRNICFPLPPLAEQRRIVARVDQLMALCDALEAALTKSQQLRQQLLEAVLQQALGQEQSADIHPPSSDHSLLLHP